MTGGLDDLEEAIEETKAKISVRREEGRKAERNKRLERERFWEEEREYLDEKMRLAREIFKWCEEFSESEHFRELLEIDSEDTSIVLSGPEPDTLRFYEGRWGHKRGDCSGRWSRLSLTVDGELLYRTGYKWMSPIDKMKFCRPEELAETLTRDYLENLHEHIQSGEVYETFKGKLENIDL